MLKDRAMMDRDALNKIASFVTDIPVSSMTKAEKNIARLLRDRSILCHVANNDTYQIVHTITGN